MKHSALFLLPVLLCAGCSTVATYEPKTAAGPARPADYPVYVYTEDMSVPRPFEILGTLHVGSTPVTVMGGSLEAEVKKIQKTARQKGADAVQLTSVRTPGFTTGNFRMDANLIRFTGQWESVSLKDDELLAYFQTNRQTLDPIEGIWAGNDPAQSRIVVIENHSKPGRDFIALVIATLNPTWRRGDKKMDIVRSERPGVYRAVYYLDDYRGKGVAITLLGSPANLFIFQLSDEGAPVVFAKVPASQ